MRPEAARILVVDDEPVMADGVALILRSAGHEPIIEMESSNVPHLVERERLDLLIVDLRMPGLDGLALLERIKTSRPELPVVMMTGYSSVDSAVEAMRTGARDYLAKPFAPEQLLEAVEKALARSQSMEESHRRRKPAASGDRYGEIVGKSRALAGVMELVDKVSVADAPVLLIGDNGTGKELVARTIHRRGPRSSTPFLAVNCGALTESLLDSELFGHERGAFTGAVATKKGIFEAADSGTLLLDEVGETSLAFQTKLLRVVQEREFLRVGATRPRRVEVRLISSSNRDLRKAVAEGRFREDLYYRLSVVQICVPPLRERADDIPLLAAHFLAMYSERIKKNVRGIRPDAMGVLISHRWPGNIRELENAVERAVVMVEDGGEILPEHLHCEFQGERSGIGQRELMVRTLLESNWNRSLAARKLGIGRRTLYDRLARLGVSLPPPSTSPALSRRK